MHRGGKEMEYQLRIKGDPILKTICKEVTAFDAHLNDIVTNMRDIMLENQGVGLAAPQIGVAERIIIVRKQLKKGIWIVINPEIPSSSTDENLGKETCLSYPGVEKEISRPNVIVIRGFDNKGMEITIKAEMLEARIFLS